MRAFAPIIGDTPKILILGSMPSEQSLAIQQYYAHPQNAFWWIMQSLCLPHRPELNKPTELSYTARCRMLSENKIALWDVLADCARAGSLDKNIVRESEQPNDFTQFFKRNPSISLVVFNGGAAKTIFMRHCRSSLKLLTEVNWLQLPSTSPAHAALSKQQKLVHWQAALSDSLTRPKPSPDCENQEGLDHSVQSA